MLFDSALARSHQINDKEWIEPAILALYVEVAELANEIQCFKYWKKNKHVNQLLVKEEYADGLHFLLSFLNEFQGIDQIEPVIVSSDLNQQFLAMFKAIGQLTKSFEQAKIVAAFAIYLGIAKLLNMSDDEIIVAYEYKNKINFERIENNY